MNQNKNLKANNSNKIWTILIGLAAITLYFNTQSVDPFNAPKLWVLILLTSILIGDLIVKKVQLAYLIKNLRILIIVLFFIVSLLISTIFTDQKYIAFFGDTQRKNGFIQYFCLTVILISTIINFGSEHIKKVYGTVLAISYLISVYGFMQHFGNDFVSWNNPYNSVILTVGNPNFAAALMSLLLVINFAALIDNSMSTTLRFMHGAVTISLFILIVYSDARQGLIAGAFGLSIFLIINLVRKSKILGKLLILIGLVIGLLMVFGMLQKGPLASLIYKGSVSIRGYYWRAAIEMFKHHPIFGVGIDSYNLYFKQYREPQYSLNYGFQITSSNAHNTFLQFFATGGIFVGVAYLIFTLSVFYVAFKKLRSLTGSEFIFYSGILGAWVAYQAQSVISIDNIGLSIWNWVLSGLLIGLSFERDNLFDKASNKTINVSKQSLSILFSWGLFLISFFTVIILYRGENNYIKLRDGLSPTVKENRPQISEQVNKVNNTFLIDPYYKFLSTNYLLQIGDNTGALEILQKSHKYNPLNLDYLQALAQYHERSNNPYEVIHYRKIIYSLDPWNAENLLALGFAYKVTQNEREMQNCLNEILSFASKHPIAEKAKSELVSNKK